MLQKYILESSTNLFNLQIGGSFSKSTSKWLDVVSAKDPTTLGMQLIDTSWQAVKLSTHINHLLTLTLPSNCGTFISFFHPRQVVQSKEIFVLKIIVELDKHLL